MGPGTVYRLYPPLGGPVNDLPALASSDTTVRLFADDCLTYRHITSPEGQNILQLDLTSLEL